MTLRRILFVHMIDEALPRERYIVRHSAATVRPLFHLWTEEMATMLDNHEGAQNAFKVGHHGRFISHAAGNNKCQHIQNGWLHYPEQLPSPPSSGFNMSSDIGPSPPWFPYLPDGSLGDICAIPDRLWRHPELEQRGLVSKLYQPIKAGCVYSTDPGIDPAYAVKILDPNMEEIVIQERLLREIVRPNNHTLASEITVTGHPLLIMPLVETVDCIHPDDDKSLSMLLDVMFQIVEGIEFLHSLHIGHMDICVGNMLTADAKHASMHEQVLENRLYIIDFGQSKQFALGPGVQRAITLPKTQIAPPTGLRHFDPYWDIYCIGRTMERFVWFRYTLIHETSPPWLATKLIKWLIGNERGCTGVCRYRPSAHQAMQVAREIQTANPPKLSRNNRFRWERSRRPGGVPTLLPLLFLQFLVYREQSFSATGRISHLLHTTQPVLPICDKAETIWVN
ncbi:hypothetical protein VTO73DRAFT_4267 [Trametes versicolor]